MATQDLAPAEIAMYRRASRIALGVSIVLFAVFTVEILLRKFGAMIGIPFVDISAVIQVLLLFGAAIAFVVASLLRERIDGRSESIH